MAFFFYNPVFQQVSQTLINPYSGYELEIDDIYGVDNTPYIGTSGADIMIMSTGNEILNIEDSNGNQIFSAIEEIIASNGNDIINLASTTYTLGNMTVHAGNGDDVVWSNSGNDILYGNDGNDIIDGGAGNDFIYGGQHDDILFGGEGEDFINGHEDNDQIYGGAGNDILNGYTGDDQITGGAGNDEIIGSDGIDIAYFVLDFSQYTLTSFVGGMYVEALTGDEGTDTVHDDVEMIVFADGEYENGVFTEFNVAPVLGKDSASVDEDSSVIINVLANDYDPNGDIMTVISVSHFFHGTAVINPDNTITYTPDPDFFGAESLLYKVSDGNGGITTQRINITINEVADEVEPNLAPILGKDNKTMDEDTSAVINVLANDYDPNGDILAVINVFGMNHGLAVINADNTITYTPDENFHGEDSFYYQASDGNGGTATQRINVTVNDVPDEEPSNAAPDLAKDNVYMGDNETVIINPLANDSDPDGDVLTITNVAGMSHGTVIINADNTLTYTVDTDYVGGDSFLYTVSDGNGGTATQRINVTINDTVDIYSFDSDDFTTPETISAFESGDALDISDILSGYDELTDAITDFVQITDNGADSVISVDADGGADNFVQIATLIDVIGLTDEAALETSGVLITV